MVSEAQTRLAHYIASQGIWSYKGVIKLMEARNNDKVSDLKDLAHDAGLDCKLEQSMLKLEYEKHPYFYARLVKEAGVDIFSDALWAFSKAKYNPKAKVMAQTMIDKLNAQGITNATLEQKAEWKQDFRHFMADRASRLVEGSPFVETEAK